MVVMGEDEAGPASHPLWERALEPFRLLQLIGRLSSKTDLPGPSQLEYGA
jgi:hypothetical protein